jgi:hypothetical protein
MGIDPIGYPVVREPVPASIVVPMGCRRGIGQATFQGQTIPLCSGTIKVRQNTAMTFPIQANCPTCGLTHFFFMKNKELLYGAAL